MKTESWIIFIACIVLCFYIPYWYNANLTTNQTQEDITVKTNLTVSCSDALRTALDGHLVDVFETKENRNVAIATFYDTFCECFNFQSEYDRNLARYYVPCIALVGWDGYYMSYAESYTDADGYTYYTDIITEQKPWSETYGSYHVRYRLDGNVTVVAGISAIKGKKYEGTREDILAEDDLKTATTTGDLSFFSSASDFEKEKDYVITRTINDSVQYHMNTHNDYFNKFDADYTFSMPDTTSFSARNLKTPTVLAFMQGYQKKTGNGDYINIYALSASDVTKENVYYMQKGTLADGTEKLFYHTQSCPELTNKSRMGTMEECASKGAYPCECFYGYNH